MERKWKIFFLVATSIFMSTLDSSIVNVALPYMIQDLKTDVQTIQWVVLSYLLSVSSLLLTFGRLSDIKGRRIIYISGFSTFTLGSLFCGLASTPFGLILSRILQGCGASMLMACSPALIVDIFEPKERGRALGMMGSVVAAGLTTGPVIGGIILEYLSWRYIFFINLPIGVAAAAGGALLMSKDKTAKGSNEPMDLAGSGLLILFLSCFLLMLTWLTQWGALSWQTAMLFCAGVVFVTAFWINEKKSKFPLFDLGLLRIRLFVFPVISSTIMFSALFVIIFMMPFYLTYPCGFNASKTGVVMIVPFIFLLLVSPVSGMLYDRYGSRKLCMTGMSLVLASLISLMYLAPQASMGSILWRIALTGIGTALFVSPNNTAAMNAAPLQRRGIASGTVATARNIGMILGVALAGIVFTTGFASYSGGSALEQYTPQMQPYFMTGFKRAMTAGVFLCAAGLITTFARGKEPA